MPFTGCTLGASSLCIACSCVLFAALFIQQLSVVGEQTVWKLFEDFPAEAVAVFSVVQDHARHIVYAAASGAAFIVQNFYYVAKALGCMVG